jgi:trehalose utilization protein
MNILIYNEFIHENESESIKSIYPNGIHRAIADAVGSNNNVKVLTIHDVNEKLNEDLLDETDVLIWWAHINHDKVSDSVSGLVRNAVLKGMGFIALHSAHKSKPFMALMGTSCNLRWRENERERLWVTSPIHPIAKGLPEYFELPQEEMYGEFFDIPKPDDVVFTGWFAGGEVFRSGCTFTRGYGRIFYFQPGHEEYPIYYNENIIRVLQNAVNWAAPCKRISELICVNPASLETGI